MDGKQDKIKILIHEENTPLVWMTVNKLMKYTTVLTKV